MSRRVVVIECRSVQDDREGGWSIWGVADSIKSVRGRFYEQWSVWIRVRDGSFYPWRWTLHEDTYSVQFRARQVTFMREWP